MAPKGKEKPKPSPPSENPQSVPLEDLFSDLHRHSQGFEYDQVVKVANQVLAIAPGDEDALRCKVVALIKSDAIEGALSTIQASEGLAIDLRFYKAYCLYRQNKLHEALECMDGQERNAMVLQLESQILYRLVRMDACMESYEKLQKFKIESLDLKTNMIAALISSGRASEVQGTMDALKVKPSSSFELAYNTACSLIERGKYAEAEQQLLSARRIGQEMLMEEDFADDEIETELAPIAVQLAYVRQLLGHTQEAVESYTDIVKRSVADATSLAIATNNLIALKGTKESADSLRKLDRLIERDGSSKLFQFSSGLDFKLSPRQKEALFSNRLLLLLQANKIDQAQELAAALSDLFPDSTTPVLLQAAVLVREKKIPKAEEILGKFAEKYPEKSKSVFLARAQIAAAAGHLQISAESLSKVPDIQHMPATVATVVSLQDRSGDPISAISVLDSAIQWWKHSMMSEENKLDVIMREAASFKLNHGREEEACQLYEELANSHGSIEAIAGLVATAARTDIDKAELYEKRLRVLPGFKGINPEILEKTSGAKVPEGLMSSKMKMEASDEVKKVRSKKRKRKPRYPKGFDPANPGPPPDPERWLPKRERSTYRTKRKDKRAQVRGSQGAVGRETAAGSTGGPSNSRGGQNNAGPSKGSGQKATKVEPSKGSGQKAAKVESQKASTSKSRKKSRS